MKEDDLILFYKKGAFVYAGQLLFKQHSKDLGLSLWPPKKGEEPWTCIFFLKNLQPIYFPIQSLNELSSGEYNMGVVQGFMPIKESVEEKFWNKFKSIENFLKNYSAKPGEVSGDLEDTSQISEENAHREAQMLLLKMGIALGYQTYSPDKAPTAFDEPLSNYVTLKDLPRRYIGDQIVDFVRKIDVLWFDKDVPKFAFEVENTTGLRSGFQRLVQLQPLGAKLYIVARDADLTTYEQILNVDPYYKSKESFRFCSYKKLEKFFVEVDRVEAIKKAFLD